MNSSCTACKKILDDAQLIISSQGYDVLSQSAPTKQLWFSTAKRTRAKAIFRGDKFVVLAGSVIDPTYSKTWGQYWPKSLVERQSILKKYGAVKEGVFELKEDIPFKSPNHAGGFTTGRNVNAWLIWKDTDGRTMDEVMRKS